MRKIFIDAGAHDGCSVRKFRKETDKNNECFIYSFEADSSFAQYFNKGIVNHKFINKAVWIRDGKENFYISKEPLKAGGTLIKKKKSGKVDKRNPITVETIDFSKWVLKNLSKDDFIILKMDIEGAEYQVIPKMIKDGSFNFINLLWIEWHWPKINYSKEEHDKLVSKISIPTKKWDALLYCSLRKRKRK